MDSEPIELPKLRYITLLGSCLNRNLPTNFTDEAIKGNIANAQIELVGLTDRVQNNGGVFNTPAKRAYPILIPRERHDAVAANSSEGWPQPHNSTSSRRAENGSAGLAADSKTNETGGGRGCRAGR